MYRYVKMFNKVCFIFFLNKDNKDEVFLLSISQTRKHILLHYHRQQHCLNRNIDQISTLMSRIERSYKFCKFYDFSQIRCLAASTIFRYVVPKFTILC